MKKLFLSIILVALSYQQLGAQNYFDKLGSFSQEEIDLKSCNYDPSANAVVLFDVGKSSFIHSVEGFDILFERISRIKILNEAGMEYSEVSIPYYQEGDIYERVEIIKACTYTIENGKIIKTKELDPKTCFKEKISKNWRTLKFAMPDVQAGSIIEYKYNIISQYHFNLHDWDFQWSIPVLYSGYETRMIPFYEYTWLLQGRKSIDDYQEYTDESVLKRRFAAIEFSDKVYKFGLKNVPAFADEEFIPSREDNVIKIDFQLSGIIHTDGVKIDIMTTWPELVKDYLKHSDFGKYIKKSQNASSTVLNHDSLIGKSQVQIFNYIVNYAKDNFSWNNENSQFAGKSPSDLQKDKSGNSAEINLWLVGALLEAKIEAYPVVLSTRKHGKIRSDYPFSNAFNTVVACATLDGRIVLADATDPYCPNTKISMQCMNDKGLLIDKDKMGWISLQSQNISVLNTSININLIEKQAHAIVIVTASDYEAIQYNNQYSDNREIMLRELSKKNYQVNDSSLKFPFSLDRTKPYTYGYKLINKPEFINEKIYINPFLKEVITENPLKQKTRTYPIDMTYPVRRIYHSEIKIPDGYKVEFLPGNSTQNDELFEFDYHITQNENNLMVSFSYAFKKSIYEPNEYAMVKTLFDRIVKRGSDKIVLVKK